MFQPFPTDLPTRTEFISDTRSEIGKKSDLHTDIDGLKLKIDFLAFPFV